MKKDGRNVHPPKRTQKSAASTGDLVGLVQRLFHFYMRIPNSPSIQQIRIGRNSAGR